MVSQSVKHQSVNQSKSVSQFLSHIHTSTPVCYQVSQPVSHKSKEVEEDRGLEERENSRTARDEATQKIKYSPLN